jgi:hypothetical protein
LEAKGIWDSGKLRGQYVTTQVHGSRFTVQGYNLMKIEKFEENKTTNREP